MVQLIIAATIVIGKTEKRLYILLNRCVESAETLITA